MPTVELDRFDPGPAIPRLLDGAERFAAFIGIAAEGIKINRSQLRQDESSAGLVGTVVEVTTDARFVAGTLIIAVSPQDFGRIAPETVRVFHRHDDDQRFTLTGFSGVGATGTYLWARICGAGRYAAFGLDKDHVLLRTVEALTAARDLLAGADPDVRRGVARSIAKALLRTPAASNWPFDPALRANLCRAALARGLPAPLFDEDISPASADDVLAFAERFARSEDQPEVQLMLALRQRDLTV